ncbi:MAG: YggS family pyridoxal phosphate-dependent enzyme [Armatimonadetes bacterium]|nr:YggS family pyridoxal phosphate-dependent enzyme [Armatimonadota bacterium]MDW8121218.1 YggS family pyridoxal phosphate-dependent enzyme [Armatimonadota bacterium]
MKPMEVKSPGNATIGQALQRVRERITAAALRAGRKPEEILLIGATKSVPVEVIKVAIQCGLTDIGENYAQEAWAKFQQIGHQVRWHFIGALQTNKAKVVARFCQTIHSLDRLTLAEELSRRAEQNQRVLECLIEVNLGGEATKSGVDRMGVLSLAEKVAKLPSLRLVGLMTIPPYHPDAEMSRLFYRELRKLRDRIQDQLGLALPHLSMGMSQDFEVAIEEGATMVRIGTALFGPRPVLVKEVPRR